METKYFRIMSTEMKPNVYGGDDCNIHEPRWETYAEGDMDSETDHGDIVLDCKTFPAGTIVIIKTPCCPKCDMDVEMCKSTENCDFDWKEWTEDRYG